MVLLWQALIFPQQYTLILTPTLTESWIPTRSVTFADQGSPSDLELEEDTQILATLLKYIPACIDAADIELLLQDIPVHPPVVNPARTMQKAVQAKDLQPLDVDAANVFSQSEL